MRRIVTLAATALAGLLIAGSAIAAERTTGSAVLVNPNTREYVGTFVQDCSQPGHPYIGAYVETPVQLEDNQSLSLSTMGGMLFTSSPRAGGEEATLSEVGGISRTACLPAGTKIDLLFYNGHGPIVVLGEGVIVNGGAAPVKAK